MTTGVCSRVDGDVGTHDRNTGTDTDDRPVVTAEGCVGVVLPSSRNCFSLPCAPGSPLEQGGAAEWEQKPGAVGQCWRRPSQRRVSGLVAVP